ncbi:uncharacterized protein LOC126968649 [Leptidea sinapis]|uniref:Uncharacterized protein n=1 Tax=Leptidea sinapis TaxID=189913 RepID=A0A5E4Q5Q4_9NEOP|nr:uncharacterized protein LOC126968649 [Leptidea sinapis]VVC92619.1 unnamed protein product [Leptidea sinapis]
MAQGKMKLKSKLPDGAKVKKGKGKAVTKRSNAPVKSKDKVVKKNKMKNTVTKMVNAAAEKQLRALATGAPELSAAQQRVAKAPTAPTPAK